MKIKDLCSYAPKSRIKAGEAVENANYLFFTSSANENKRYTDFQFDKEAIIMGTGGNATLHYYNGKFSVSTDCLVLFPNSKIKCKYLYYFFKSHMSVLEAGFKGAGLKHTNKKYIEEINVSKVPDLTTQEKIVSHLDTITENIEKLNRELELFDSLTKARFVEMFGDYLKYDRRPLSEVAIITGGLTKNSNRNTFETKMPYLRVANVFYNRLDLREILKIGVKEEEIEKTLLQAGDLLFVEGNGSIEQIGRVAIWDGSIDPILHQNHLIKARFNNEIIAPEYALFYFMLQDGRQQIISKSVSTSGLNTLSVNKVSSLLLPIPPIALQKQFSVFVKLVDKSREAVKKSLEKTQQLYDSLMQEYFG